MVSTGGPVKRSASDRSPVSPATPLTWNDRVRVSGLYCREMILCTTALTGSISTMPPLRSLGDPGNPLIVLSPHPGVRPLPRTDLPSRPTALSLMANSCCLALRCQVLLFGRSTGAIGHSRAVFDGPPVVLFNLAKESFLGVIKLRAGHSVLAAEDRHRILAQKIEPVLAVSALVEAQGLRAARKV